MVRRSTPQKKLDERDFAVRVRFVPDRDYGNRMREVEQWLDENVGRGEYAHHTAEWASAYYFRTVDDAVRLVHAFPDLKLTDRQNAAWQMTRRS